MNYFQALKEWNKGKNIYCSPKKGTKEHAEVLAIQKKGSSADTTSPVKSSPKPKPKKEKSTPLPNLPQLTPPVISVPRSSSKAPSATAVKMRKNRKTGSAVKLAVPKSTNVPDEDYVDITTGMKMKRKKVKVAIPVADRPLPTTEFSKRKPTMPTTEFSSRSGNTNMPLTQFSSRGGGGASIISQSVSNETSAPSGVLGKEAGKMINMAIKGKLARKRMAEAEKQMLFDIFLN